MQESGRLGEPSLPLGQRNRNAALRGGNVGGADFDRQQFVRIQAPRRAVFLSRRESYPCPWHIAFPNRPRPRRRNLSQSRTRSLENISRGRVVSPRRPNREKLSSRRRRADGSASRPYHSRAVPPIKNLNSDLIRESKGEEGGGHISGEPKPGVVLETGSVDYRFPRREDRAGRFIPEGESQPGWSRYVARRQSRLDLTSSQR